MKVTFGFVATSRSSASSNFAGAWESGIGKVPFRVDEQLLQSLVVLGERLEERWRVGDVDQYGQISLPCHLPDGGDPVVIRQYDLPVLVTEP